MEWTATRERVIPSRSASRDSNPLPTQCMNPGSFLKVRFQWAGFVALVFLVSLPLSSQSNSGELHITVTAPSGRGIRASVKIVSSANEYRNALETSDQGTLVVQRLPFGIYELEVDQPGFAHRAQSVEIRSSLPTNYRILLSLPTVNQSVTVSSVNTLIDPDQAGSISQIGTDLIQHRL